uniref:Macaca fascicularis brain cDNA clone: QtrA-18159, similar to human neurobeachin (NBEA), mRNA, RefSeq: NM_015678.2 n=1 Tax=Macaca fascicularis TaxID=9541 RepID=I7GF11_MACFA|nr:unnamed protein product [Macaca fascicularis]
MVKYFGYINSLSYCNHVLLQRCKICQMCVSWKSKKEK